jgi:hypothetical protein
MDLPKDVKALGSAKNTLWIFSLVGARDQLNGSTFRTFFIVLPLRWLIDVVQMYEKNLTIPSVISLHHEKVVEQFRIVVTYHPTCQSLTFEQEVV